LQQGNVKKAALMTRIDAKFADLEIQGKKSLCCLNVMAGDQTLIHRLEIVRWSGPALASTSSTGPALTPIRWPMVRHSVGRAHAPFEGGMTLDKTLALGPLLSRTR